MNSAMGYGFQGQGQSNALEVLLSHPAFCLLDAVYHLFRCDVLQQFLELRITRSW
jgi:hypothetical protein